MEKSEIILLGQSIAPPEMDDEEVDNIENEVSYQYDMENILDVIGTTQFEDVFSTTIQSIQILSIEVQQDFCIRILKKISSVYNYEFPYKFDFVNQENINMVYSFITFLEYDYLDFFSNMWKYLGVNLRELDIKSYCKENSNQIIKEIEEQIELRNLDEMRSIFLRTYIKDDMIKFLIRITMKDKMLMLVNMLE